LADFSAPPENRGVLCRLQPAREVIAVDYYQSIVVEYLRADRATFVNTECLLQLEPGDIPTKGTHWYCDVVAVNFRDRGAVYLCEVTYSATPHPLLRRLQAWSANWSGLRSAIARDCGVPKSWQVQPWLFIPEERHAVLNKKLLTIANMGGDGQMPAPRVTYLESVVPWKFQVWNRRGSALEVGARQAGAAAGQT
jgi:hypothetical protein